jgi:hypothetical protein
MTPLNFAGIVRVAPISTARRVGFETRPYKTLATALTDFECGGKGASFW